MKKVRGILIFIVGGIVIYLSYKSKYQIFVFEAVLWVILIFVGFPLFVWTIFKDIKNYIINRKFQNFCLTIISFVFIGIVLAMEYKINRDFNKPTLLKVYYDGDINGTGIDFKKDGTYIFDNSAIGISNYIYGSYQIIGNKITLDKKQLDNVILTDKLEIRENYEEHSGGIKNRKCLFQIDENGNVLIRETEFKVTIDNRE